LDYIPLQFHHICIQLKVVVELEYQDHGCKQLDPIENFENYVYYHIKYKLNLVKNINHFLIIIYFFFFKKNKKKKKKKNLVVYLPKCFQHNLRNHQLEFLCGNLA